VQVACIELGNDGDPDIIRLSGDDYLVINHKEAERAGLVFVSLNESMSSGGDLTHADWTIPPVTLKKIVAYLQDN
jgi:hypothetical protein